MSRFELLLSLSVAQHRLKHLKNVIADQRQLEGRRLRRKWVRNIFLHRNQSLVDDVMTEAETTRNFLRMSVVDFEWLLACVTPKIKKQDTNMRQAISPLQRLSIALRFLATGDLYTSLQYTFRVSPHTISGLIPEVCEAIIDVLKEYVKLPNRPSEWLQISSEFERQWNFPHVIGAIDGKHVVLKAPKNAGSEFFNYKGTHSIVLLAVVDAHYNFIFADVGCQGKISDGGVLANTVLKRKFVNKGLRIPEPEILRIPYSVKVPYMLLGDKAFAMTEWCLRPYANFPPRRTPERTFNYRHSRARRVVENAFGILSAVFRCLRTTLEVEPKVAEKIVLSCVYLHNFLRKRTSAEFYAPNGTFDRDLDEESFEPGSWRNDMPTGSMLNLLPVRRNISTNMHNVRLHIAHELFLNNRME